MKRKRYYRPDISSLDIPSKANRILNLVLLAIILIVIRVWHLAVIQYDQRLEESRKPQRRVVIEAAKRGTIRDRFNIPLAINKIQYNASLLYSQLREVPSVIWEKDASGKKVKRFKRKEYITSLASLLGKELNLDPERLEDLIHSKASFYYQLPFVIKEDISEREYYRLKMLEKDWLGVHVQKVPKRYYPLKRMGADVIGYMGAINRQEYEKIIGEIKTLQVYFHDLEEGEDVSLPEGYASNEEALNRLQDLEEHSYTIHDYVGKTGIEGRFEELLRGFHGKKSYYSDARGNFLRELPGSREPLSGQRILLTLSAELQEYAEKLLAQNESIREARASGVDIIKQTLLSLRQPWIKGGAIVVMDPNNGDILALASHPRIDPNDFIVTGNPEISREKQSRIQRWFESENYIAEIWDQKRPFERELFDDAKDHFYDQAELLTWDRYLNFILPQGSVVRENLGKVKSIKNAIDIQNGIKELAQNQANLQNVLEEEVSKSKFPSLRKKVDPYFVNMKNHYDKLLLIDVCRLVVCADRFSSALISSVGDQEFAFYRDANAAKVALTDLLKSMTKELYHEEDFKKWRQENEKHFLKEKREEEKQAHRYPKPYIDYLDAQETDMFQSFWKSHCWDILMVFLRGKESEKLASYYQDYFLTWHKELQAGAHQALPWREKYRTLQNAVKSLNDDLLVQYLQTMRSFKELDQPLLGKYRFLRKQNGVHLEKHLAAAFYPKNGFGYGRSQAYRQATTPGSIFKLITAYEALAQRYHKIEGQQPITFNNLNPLDMTDAIFRHGKEACVGYHADGKPIPKRYKGGRMIKSHQGSMGKLDLLRALENSSNPYFSILAGDVLKDPEDLARAARQFSYGARTGIDLPLELSGNIPNDISINRTGLYAMAIGQHTLVATPVQTAVFLSTLANGGKVLKPKIVRMTAGHHSERGNQKENRPVIYETEVKRTVFLPTIIRDMLLEGMYRVVMKQHKESINSLSRFYHDYPEAISDYIELKDQVVGKTSTSEVMENIDLDKDLGTNLYTHVWFGGIAFKPEMLGLKRNSIVIRDKYGKPELVVVVYLRFGAFGKEAAPLAAQMIKKWHAINARHH